MSEDDLQHKVDALEDELAKLRDEMASQFAARAQDAKEPDTQSDEDAPTSAGRIEREINATLSAGKRALSGLDEMAVRHPVGSLAVAFTAGIVIARIFAGGRRR